MCVRVQHVTTQTDLLAVIQQITRICPVYQANIIFSMCSLPKCRLLDDDHLYMFSHQMSFVKCSALDIFRDDVSARTELSNLGDAYR